jgi:hypothetical protein
MAIKKRGLGRGLDALLSSTPAVESGDEIASEAGSGAANTHVRELPVHELGHVGGPASRGHAAGQREQVAHHGGGTHAGLAGRQCGFYFGDAAASGATPATAPGTVTCD